MSMMQQNAIGIVEEWRPIPNLLNEYDVSDFGNVRSVSVFPSRAGRQRGRVLSSNVNRKGYLWFRVCPLDGKSFSMTVHKAVALAFIGPRPDGMQINHKDGDKTNNTPANLEYVTCRENIRHAWANGFNNAEHGRGEKNNFAKLTADDVIAIRRLDAEMTRDGLAELYGVSSTTISHIVNRKTWKHV